VVLLVSHSPSLKLGTGGKKVQVQGRLHNIN
jgi:hypothetical protein